ncbi:MAG: substrate-binding domain-containing protein [Dysosmobacter sp.]
MFLEEEQRPGGEDQSLGGRRPGQPDAQNEQVDRFLDQGCDVICVNIVDRTAAAVIVDKARAAGVR